MKIVKRGLFDVVVEQLAPVILEAAQFLRRDSIARGHALHDLLFYRHLKVRIGHLAADHQLFILPEFRRCLATCSNCV